MKRGIVWKGDKRCISSSYPSASDSIQRRHTNNNIYWNGRLDSDKAIVEIMKDLIGAKEKGLPVQIAINAGSSQR